MEKAAKKNHPGETTLLLVEDPALNRFLSRLRPGMQLKARIVLCLGNGRYLMRIQGFNLVMHSHFRFNRFDEVVVRVEQTQPKLKVRLNRRIRAGEAGRLVTDVWI